MKGPYSGLLVAQHIFAAHIFLSKFDILRKGQIHTLTFIAVLFVVVKNWKEPKCPSTGEQLNIPCGASTTRNMAQPSKGGRHRCSMVWGPREVCWMSTPSQRPHTYRTVPLTQHHRNDSTLDTEQKGRAARGGGLQGEWSRCGYRRAMPGSLWRRRPQDLDIPA